MISCKFVVPNKILKKVDSFVECLGLSNFSSFENSKMGFSDDLDDNGFPVAKFFNIEIFASNNDVALILEKSLKNKFSNEIQNFEAVKLEDTNWIDLYIKELKPVLCDRFYFYNDKIQTAPEDKKLIPIKLNSALAFGSGHHQTTQGCLLNIIHLNNLVFRIKNILDMGCGTGILGICALKIWPKAKLLGIDIDPEAARVTQENYLANEIKAEVMENDNISFLNSKVDLILCNILKQPLIDLCDNFYDKMNLEGYIITSGFTTRQELDILNHYQNRGFEVANRIHIQEWISILFRKKC